MPEWLRSKKRGDKDTEIRSQQKPFARPILLAIPENVGGTYQSHKRTASAGCGSHAKPTPAEPKAFGEVGPIDLRTPVNAKRRARHANL
jgi:hypothetical protein